MESCVVLPIKEVLRLTCLTSEEAIEVTAFWPGQAARYTTSDTAAYWVR